MAWDPSVLRKYNTTGHFRLLSQLRGELKSNPLLRPKEGQTVAEANRSRALQRATEGRGSSARTRTSRRSSTTAAVAQAAEPIAAAGGNADDAAMHGPFTVVPLLTADSVSEHESAGFLDRLNAIDLR
ncbi:MAG: hypothetical protein FJ078_04215 [Cyanobacteria bacterium K_DeepCast_35m_m2_155]|nr:hypothetical protein [Cyanobacteria bacterium K_DeepCast_35m_m2_155]